MKACTSRRELRILFYNGQQQGWFLDLILSFYGSLADAKLMHCTKRSIFNAFNVFAKARHGSFVQVFHQWRKIKHCVRTKLVDLALELTRGHRERRS